MEISGLVPRFKSQLLSIFQIPFIPYVEKIKAPRELLLEPPYYFSIQASSTCITVQSSHSPSLEFLAEYLRENCRRSRKHVFALKNIFKTEGPLVIDIKLHQDPFTPKPAPKSSAESSAKSNAIYNTLTLKAALVFGGLVNRISSLILIRLVKDELGYELQSSDQNSWYLCSMGVPKGL